MSYAIYIHIPFCMKKCLYCDFVSFPLSGQADTDQNKIQTYVDALVSEIGIRAAAFEMKETGARQKPLVHTIFLGGGTPSLLSTQQMQQIKDALEAAFDLSELVEFTVETNPGTVDEEKLRGYRFVGINRLSIGVQSLDDEVLITIGRVHDKARFIETYASARKAGFDNISLDLMFGLPGQSLNMLERDLRAVLELKPEHVSAYSLKVEEGTPFHKMESKGQLQLPDEDTERQMHAFITKELAAAGYQHYEISNYALEGRESKHNKAYWTMVPYFAFGLAAHGFTGHMRYANTSDLKTYYEQVEKGCLPLESEEVLSREDLIFESLMVGLRLLEGVDVSELEAKYAFDFDSTYGNKVEKLIQKGMLFKNGTKLKMTEAGMDIQNTILAELLL